MSKNETVKVRFAPSPTGYLHVGNVRTALVNWLFARHTGGQFLLRLDDTDRERSSDAFAEAIEEDMAWLGLDWDEKLRQSDRLKSYQIAIDDLKEKGRLYPCFETPEELSLKRKSLLSRGKPPIYDRAALDLSASEIAEMEDAGRKPHWRFRLGGEALAWNDLVHGDLHFEPANLSDPVLIRSDAYPLYTLTSVVDDIDTAITHVVRGDDHIANSAVQIDLIHALGGDAPVFAHLPLLTDFEGGELSKRIGGLALRDLRAEGIEPMAINSHLARLGTSAAIAHALTLDELVAEFDFSRFSRNSPKFDADELRRLNAALLHGSSFEVMAPHLKSAGMGEVDEALWEAVRPNLERLEDIRGWIHVCRGALTPVIADREFIEAALGCLPDEPWDEATWGKWTKEVKALSGRKGRELFLPLRLALTGLDHGPELKALLPIIGRDRALARLQGQTA